MNPFSKQIPQAEKCVHRQPANNSMQRTALRAAADAERSARRQNVRFPEVWSVGLASAFACVLAIGCAKPAATAARRIQPPPVDSNNNRPFDVCKTYLKAMSKGDSEKAQSLRSRFFRTKVDADAEAAAADLVEFQKWWADQIASGDYQIFFRDEETRLAKDSSSVWVCKIRIETEGEGTPIGSDETTTIFATMEDGVWRVAHPYEADARDPAEPSDAADSR